MAVSRFKTSTILNGTPKYRNANVGALPLPATPTVGTATDLGTGTTVSVGFTPVGSYGQQFTAVSSPGSLTGTSVVSPIVVSGLSAGTAYTFQVRSENATGFSALSSASNSVTPVVPTAFESIATVTAAGGETSLTFSNIPQGYASLQIRGFGRLSSTPKITLNSNSSAIYAIHSMRGTGSSVIPSASTADTAFLGGAAYTSGTNLGGVSIIDFLNYATVGQNRTIRIFNGYDENGSGAVYLSSGLWNSTAAITRIDLGVYSTSWLAGTTFALYGIKGAA